MRKLFIPILMTLFLSGCSVYPVEEFSDYTFSRLDDARVPGKPGIDPEVIKKHNEDTIWNQPVNKDVKCLLPISKDFLTEPNAKQYWDGACSGGYAYGLGRDIAISDKTHVEEVVFHDKNKDMDYGPFIVRNYITKETTRGYRLGSYGEYHFLSTTEKLLDDQENDFAMIAYTGHYATPEGPVFYWRPSDDWETTLVVGLENNLQYIRQIKIDNAANSYFAIDFIGIGDESINDILGKSIKPVFMIFDAIGERANKISWNGVIKETDHPQAYFYNNEAKEILDRAQKLLHQKDLFKKVENLEKRYGQQLKFAKTPRGLSSDVYHEYDHYYELDGFWERYKLTQERFEQQAQNEKNQQESNEGENGFADMAAKTIESIANVFGFSHKR